MSMTYRCDFDLPKQQAALDTLREKTQNPDFWADQNRAKTIMRDVARMEREISTWQSLETSLAENQELIELFIDDSTQELESEIIAALDKIEAEFQTLELRLKLGGAYDTRPALISVYAGSGGTDAQDWAELLLRMYIRWANSQKMETEIISITNGDEAGIKSADIKISGDFAYGLLQSEKGVHRLVRISPFDSAKARHTSFALVEIVPEAQHGELVVDIKTDELRIDTFKASGNGGQNVQKNDTAVRIVHEPTGIVVTCQNERSQGRNREQAMLVLESRLLDLEIKRREEEEAKLRGEHIEAGWGNQIRSYVLHPYQMVKDLRTNYETSNVDDVLDGDIMPLINSYLNEKVGKSVG